MAEREVDKGTRGQFSSFQFQMRRELLWSWCCSGFFLCASGHPFSFHLLQTLATMKRENKKTLDKAPPNLHVLLKYLILPEIHNEKRFVSI